MSDTSTALTAPNIDAPTAEIALVGGDLSKLSAPQRLSYYRSVCESLRLNPLTRPFEYITLNGKLTLYARRDAADQLRRQHNVSVEIVSREFEHELYIVTARAHINGRADESTGAVSVKGLQGEALANAIMKCETKAKRRVTLSICGLGWLDETEAASIPDAAPVVVTEEGEIVPPAAPHWATDKGKLAAFHAKLRDLGVTHEDAHCYLGVRHLTDYDGTGAEALRIIRAAKDAEIEDAQPAGDELAEVA